MKRLILLLILPTVIFGQAVAPLKFHDSLVNTANIVTLVNDTPSPGNLKYYGTNGVGVLGFFNFPTPTSTPTATPTATATNTPTPTATATATPTSPIVLSWNARTGAVVPVSGDYTAAQVTNAVANNASNTYSTGTQDFTGATNTLVTTQAASDNSTKAASTSYVTTGISNAIAGVNPAVAVQAATTAAGDTSGFTYNNGVGGIGATLTGPTANVAVTVDGFTFTALGQRVLVKNDTQSPSGAFNGVYYVTTLQGIAIKPVLTRALDYDMPSDMNNTGAIPVVNGTVNADTSWLLTSSVTTVGTDPLTYVQFSINPTSLVQTSRTLTIFGSTQDLSANRTWSTPTVTPTPTVTATPTVTPTPTATATPTATPTATAVTLTIGTVAQDISTNRTWLTSIKDATISGRNTHQIVSSGNASIAVQGAVWASRPWYWYASNASSAGAFFGPNIATVISAGTFTTPNPATTNLYTLQPRGVYASVITTTNQQVGIRGAALQWLRGNSAGQGGFLFVCRFGIETWTAGDRLFVGMSNAAGSLTTGQPSAITNMLGFGIDASDTAITFMHNDGSGTATKDAIAGTTLASNQGYDAYIFCKPNDTTVYYRLDDVNAGTTLADTSTATDLPVNTTFLLPAAVMGNAANTAATAAQIGISSIYIETDR